MSSTFLGLETSLRGLLAEQYSLDTTSHNISNANTAGYSRQEAVLQASADYQIEAGVASQGVTHVGTGVEVTTFTRLRNTFLDAQYRAQGMQAGYQQQRSQQLDQVQSGLSEPGANGLSAQLSKFWDAWAAVSNDPSSQAARQSLVSQGSNLAASFQTLATQFQSDRSQAAAQYASLTGPQGQVSQIANQIASLNGSIQATEAGGTQPNDLLDQRDQLLDQLSKLGQVSVTDLGGGPIKVQFGDAAQPLVSGTTVTWPQTLTSPGGQLGALIDFTKTGGVVDGYTSQLNAAAKTLADAVNAIHTTGTPAGVKFFSYTAGSEASTLGVAVTAAQVVTSTGGAPDANNLALAISQLRGGAADNSYTALITQIGADDQNAGTANQNANALLSSIESQRQSVSGVSMDEEMANLQRFQRGYEASARAMNAFDSMLQSLLNIAAAGL